jgi:predicted nuclease with TOPRIM domain
MRQAQGYATQFAGIATGIQKEMTELQNKLRRSQTLIRALMNEGSPDLERKKDLEAQAHDLQSRMDLLKNEMVLAGGQLGNAEQTIQNATLGVSAAVGIPTLMGLAYANDSLHNR